MACNMNLRSVEITSLSEDGEALSRGLDDPGVNSGVCGEVMATAATHSKWFAAYTVPRHEKAVGRQFEARHIPFFLPLFRTMRRWKNGCTVAVDQPLFPSYIFVQSERRELVKVLQVPGVLSVVSAGREPSVLPTAEVESLRAGLPLRHCEPHPYLVVGEKVRIISGSLEGMVGVLLRKKNHFRVVLTLDLIQQSVAVEVGSNEIEPFKA